MRIAIARSLVLASLSLGFSSCQKSDSADDIAAAEEAYAANEKAGASQQFFQTSKEINVEVWYEEAAAPYTKAAVAERDFWDITRKNLTAIFQYRSAPPSITVPSDLASMNLLSIPSQENWTSAQILALADAHKKATSTADSSTFYVYFLEGYFNKGEGSDKGILGVSLGNTKVLAMFKPVIRSTSTGVLDVVPKFVEQSTLVHELGHALGFVNNGVPATSDYQDAEHGAHSKNEDCVMYWLNEGTSNLQKFVAKYISSQSVEMWGPEVLADAKAISK